MLLFAVSFSILMDSAVLVISSEGAANDVSSARWDGTILRVFSCFALHYRLDCHFSCTFVHVLKAIEGRLLWEEIQGFREARPYAQSTF